MTGTTTAPGPPPATEWQRHDAADDHGRLFFDLVYVFAVTQLSHQILADLSVAGVARAAFLLLVVWWWRPGGAAQRHATAVTGARAAGQIARGAEGRPIAASVS